MQVCDPVILFFFFFSIGRFTILYNIVVVFAIHCHESAMGVHVSHLPPHPTQRLSQSTSFGCPASCIEFALVICLTHGNIHVTVIFSHDPVILNQPLKQFPNFHLA